MVEDVALVVLDEEEDASGEAWRGFRGAISGMGAGEAGTEGFNCIVWRRDAGGFESGMGVGRGIEKGVLRIH